MRNGSSQVQDKYLVEEDDMVVQHTKKKNGATKSKSRRHAQKIKFDEHGNPVLKKMVPGDSLPAAQRSTQASTCKSLGDEDEGYSDGEGECGHRLSRLSTRKPYEEDDDVAMRSARSQLPSRRVSLNATRTTSILRSVNYEAVAEEEENEVLDMGGFDLLHVIGDGMFSRVVCVREKATLKLYALKIMEKAHAESQGEEFRHRPMEELKVLELVDYPFLTRMSFSIQTQQFVLLGLEYVHGISLSKLIEQMGPQKERVVRPMAAELVLALNYLHSKGILHRNVHPDNVMLRADGHVVLCDMSMAVKLTKSVKKRETLFGETEYRAPEMLQGEPYGFAVDWWQLGVLMFWLLAGRHPFKKRWRSMKSAIRKGPKAINFPDHMSKRARRLISKLLITDPRKRLAGHSRYGAREVQVHPFFNGIDWLMVESQASDPPLKPPVPPVELDGPAEFASVRHAMETFGSRSSMG